MATSECGSRCAYKISGEVMLKISRLTDYAVVALSALAEISDESAAGLAARTNLPAATVAKILKQLTRAGLVTSARGAAGGYRLAKPLPMIDLAMVVEAIDGPIKLTQCIDHADNTSQPCAAAGHCALHGKWNPVNDAIATALAGISLAQLALPQVRI